LDLRLEDEFVRPAVVEASGKRAVVVEVALAEDLEKSGRLMMTELGDAQNAVLCASRRFQVCLLTLLLPYMVE
jgi:hypothetical protein